MNITKYFIIISCLFCAVTIPAKAQTVTVDLVSNAAATIDVNYTAQGSFPINIWNNQVLTITWPDTGAGGPGNNVSISVSSSNSGWFFNIQGSVSCDGNVCSQKVISSSNNINTDLSTTTSVVTLAVSGQGSDNTTYSVSGASGNLFVNHAIFGNVGTAGSSVTFSALPVELLSFDAQLTDDNRVWLDWRTASEQNNDYYLVERSTDGRQFEEIDLVAGAGTSYTELQYESWDHKPLSGVNYYRLKQVDFDGTFDYSDIRAVTLQTKDSQPQVFPNPASHQLTIRFEESPEAGVVQLFNGAGQVLLEQPLLQGSHQAQLQLDQLPEGMYWLRIRTDGRMMYSEKIVVARR